MFGAPLAGTTRAGHQGIDCAALRSILPSNFCGGGGICAPSIVALGEPGTQVICCADADATQKTIGVKNVKIIFIAAPLPEGS